MSFRQCLPNHKTRGKGTALEQQIPPPDPPPFPFSDHFFSQQSVLLPMLPDPSRQAGSISILERSRLWCSSLLTPPDCLIPSHTTSYIDYWDFFPSLCSHLYHLTIHILCLWMLLCELVNWSTDLIQLTKYLKKAFFRAIISLVWITAFLARNLCQHRARTEPLQQHRC